MNMLDRQYSYRAIKSSDQAIFVTGGLMRGYMRIRFSSPCYGEEMVLIQKASIQKASIIKSE